MPCCLRKYTNLCLSVLLVQDASPNSITTFHDLISNEIPKVLGRWSFDLKIFKQNVHGSAGGDSQFLYDLSFDNEQGKSITVVNGEAIVTTNDIPEGLIDSGCSNGAADSLDHIIQTKLQGLWLLRQTLKGENGNSYEIRNGEFVIKAINVFLHGNFKNFLIMMEYHGNDVDGVGKLERLVEELAFPKGKLSTGSLGASPQQPADLAFQYTEALNVQR